MMFMTLFTAVAAIFMYYLQPLFLPGEPSSGFKVLQPDEAPLLMEYLTKYEKDLGDDFLAYRNHCLRVMSFTTYFLGKEPDSGAKKVLQAALAYHDLALWSDMKASYLGPSADRARKDLSGSYTEPELKQVEDIIMNHHKFTESPDPLVDAMRKADWLDFTNNLRFPMRSGMPSGNLAKANQEVPLEGFFTALAKRPFAIRPDNPLKAGLEVMEIFRW
mmetsp:Transcript_144886/g.205064  ORF Transcript_144886/g.205064 Transcript_144886/m.205064 type:complete len:218 (+) Transcript_144886:62-715(+)